MTSVTDEGIAPRRKSSLLELDERTKKRNAAEKRFEIYGMIAVGVGVVALIALLSSIIYNGSGSFRQTFINLKMELPADRLDRAGNRDPVEMAKTTTFGYVPVLAQALVDQINDLGIETEGVSPRDIQGLISQEAPAQLRNRVLATNPDGTLVEPDLLGSTIEISVLANGRVDG
ncbi:MAG: DUF3333 domain-containing protein, partial [Pseudomonadota bacterium]